METSGIGKTTLLRLIGGRIPPDKGEILLMARMCRPCPVRGFLHRQWLIMVSALFQSGRCFTDMNVFDNGPAYPLREHRNLPTPLLKAS
ncbi:hypothetical protein KCP78_16215 [Salmonella enterica subsp. enterica]|nr:hypothetical protein KCP78_16215 [Salmonella enterica subsp. enterica]